MVRGLVILSVLAFSISTNAVQAAGITGQYLEARTCDVWTGPCFANAEMSMAGKHAVMAWKIDKGSSQDVSLDGLSVVAIISARDTLGLQQTGPSKAVLIVDSKATDTQRKALIAMVKEHGGELLQNVIAVQSAPIELTMCECKNDACAIMKAGNLARVETRCIDGKHDKACGNESEFYPPLVKGVKVRPAVAVDHSYSGTGFNEIWKDADRRGAYVGSFEMR